MSNVNVSEDSIDQVRDMLPLIVSSLSNLSGDVAAIDLSDIELGMDLSNTVSLIKNVISSPYSDSSISVLRQNIEYTRNALIKMNSEIGTVFDGLDEIEDFGNFTDYVGSIKTKQNSVDLETYLNTLKSQGFKVEKIPNGGYKVTTSYSCVFYLSDDCTYNDVQVISYYPGQGDVYGDTALLRSKLENNGVPSGTVAIVSFLPGTWENQETNNSAYDILERMEKDANIDVISVVSMGFSLGGFKSFTRLNDYLKTHPNIKGEDCAVICIDGITNNTKGWIEADTLAERNVPIYFLRSAQYESFAQNPGSGHDNCKMLAEMGLNTFLLLDNLDNGHMSLNEKVITTGFYDYIAGRTSTYSNASDYTVIRYNKDIQDFVDVYNFFEQDFSIGKRLVVNPNGDYSGKTIDFLSDEYITKLNEFYSQFSTTTYGKTVDLYSLKGKTTIDELFAQIRSEYCARDAAIMVAMTQAYLCMQTGGRGKYAQAGTMGSYSGGKIPVANYYTLGAGGTNCCGGVSWAVFGENDPYWLSVDSFENFGAPIDINSAKPGDIFVANHNDVAGGAYHVGLILYNDPVTKEMITWEARGENYGIGIFKRTYDELLQPNNSSQRYVFRNLEEYYNSIDAKNSLTRDKTDLIMVGGDDFATLNMDIDPTTTTDTGNTGSGTPTTGSGSGAWSGAGNYGNGSPSYTPNETPITPVNPTVNEPTANKPEVEQIVSEQNTPQNDSRPVINVEESKVVEDKKESVTEEELIIEEEPIIEEETPIEDNDIPSNNDDGIIVPEPSNSGSAKKFILPGILGAGLAALAAKLGIDFNKKRKDNDEL